MQTHSVIFNLGVSVEKPNRFFLYLGGVLFIAMIVATLWAFVVDSKFWAVILVLLAILFAVSGILTIVVAYREKHK